MRSGYPMTFTCVALAGLIGLGMFSLASAAADDKTDKPVVVLDTTEGEITIELDRAKAPVTVDNFLKYVDEGFYNGTIFHRCIPSFMIQGGGMTSDMREKRTHAPIKNESSNGLRNLRGTLAMARTSQPNSATAQFFINLKDNGFLDRDRAQDGVGYAVFGKVTHGMDVVDKIAAVPTASRGPHDDVPEKPILIRSAKRK